MNPNSQHQLWSRWTAYITSPTRLPFETVKANCARFYRKAFGAATELHITASVDQWTIDCRTEAHPAHDPAYVAYLTDQLRAFLLNGFGAGAQISFDVNVEAGDRQDGRPADQLILLPPRIKERG